jgi:hypothetical protein
MLKSQETSIARILATAIGKPQSEVESKIHAQTSLSAQEAKQWGLVQDVKTELFDLPIQIWSSPFPPRILARRSRLPRYQPHRNFHIQAEQLTNSL